MSLKYHFNGLKASSDKIIREMEMFGENFERYEPPAPQVDEEPAAAASQTASSARVDKGKKGKIAAKSTGHKYQFQILESIGVPREEVKKFADPYYWLTYFPPIAIVRYL
jgi:leucyl-tRNA synthetase